MRHTKNIRQRQTSNRSASRINYKYATDDELTYPKFITAWVRGLGFRQMTPLGLKVYQNSVSEDNKKRIFRTDSRWKLLTRVNK